MRTRERETAKDFVSKCVGRKGCNGEKGGEREGERENERGGEGGAGGARGSGGQIVKNREGES